MEAAPVYLGTEGVVSVLEPDEPEEAVEVLPLPPGTTVTPGAVGVEVPLATGTTVPPGTMVVPLAPTGTTGAVLLPDGVDVPLAPPGTPGAVVADPEAVVVPALGLEPPPGAVAVAEQLQGSVMVVRVVKVVTVVPPGAVLQGTVVVMVVQVVMVVLPPGTAGVDEETVTHALLEGLVVLVFDTQLEEPEGVALPEVVGDTTGDEAEDEALVVQEDVTVVEVVASVGEVAGEVVGEVAAEVAGDVAGLVAAEVGTTLLLEVAEVAGRDE